MAKQYKQKTKKTSKKACQRYQNLSKEEKEKRWNKARDRYQNLSEEEKDKKKASVST